MDTSCEECTRLPATSFLARTTVFTRMEWLLPSTLTSQHLIQMSRGIIAAGLQPSYLFRMYHHRRHQQNLTSTPA
jgi:hypothetical protein